MKDTLKAAPQATLPWTCERRFARTNTGDGLLANRTRQLRRSRTGTPWRISASASLFIEAFCSATPASGMSVQAVPSIVGVQVVDLVQPGRSLPRRRASAAAADFRRRTTLSTLRIYFLVFVIHQPDHADSRSAAPQPASIVGFHAGNGSRAWSPSTVIPEAANRILHRKARCAACQKGISDRILHRPLTATVISRAGRRSSLAKQPLAHVRQRRIEHKPCLRRNGFSRYGNPCPSRSIMPRIGAARRPGIE